VLALRRIDRGADRVVFFGTHGKLRPIRTSWTSLAERCLAFELRCVSFNQPMHSRRQTLPDFS
jgi:hypothetical protein